ncbi:MAG: PepSY domain-containing protein [Pseudomonadota bacterium]
MFHHVLSSLCLAVACSVATAPAIASEKDHDRARAALKAGEVLPLATVLQRVALTHPGEILEVELEREDGRWIYELKLLQRGGALVKLHVDAASGEVLKRKERR